MAGVEKGFQQMSVPPTKVTDRKEQHSGQRVTRFDGDYYDSMQYPARTAMGSSAGRMEIGQVKTSYLFPRASAGPTSARAARDRNTAEAVKRDLAQACMRVVRTQVA